MSSNSQITLRNGKIITSTTSAESTEFTRSEQIVNMENDNENVDDQAQSRQSSSGPEIDSQKANDERFSHLQSEMSMLKAMMEKLLEQNEERNRQTDTNAATSSFAVRSSNMVTGVNRTHRNQRNYFHDEEDEEEYEDTPSNSTETALLNAIHDLPRKLQKTNTKLLQTHVPNFRGSKDKYNEFEHLLLNHFRPIANKITEEDKIHFFQSLLRDEAIDFWQTITINPTTTLQDVLQLLRKEFAKEDMREVARYKWNEAKYDPTTQTFGDFLKNLEKIAKQAYGDEADKCIKMFLFGKLPIEIQQELTMANKEDSSPEEIKTYLLRNTNIRTSYNNLQRHISHLTKCLITTSNENSHAPTNLTPNQTSNDSMENVSTVVNKATGNKNAEDANEMKLMALTNQTPYNLPNGKMKISQNTTQNWYARFAGMLATQQGTAEKESQSKRAHPTDNYHINEQMNKRTKNDDEN